MLSIGFLIGVFFVYLFILRSKGFSIFNYYLFAIISSLSIVLCKLYIANVYSSDALILGQITSLILLYVAILYLTEDKIRSRFLFQISILFFASWISTSGRDIDIYTYGKNLINKDEKVYFYDKSKQDVGLLSIEENLSIKAFADKNNKNLSYMPISIPGITCIEKSAYTAIDMNIITFDRINQNQLAKSNFIITKYNDSVIYNKFLWKTNLTMYLNPCSPEPLTIIDSILKKSLIKTYVIVNPVFYD